MIDGQIIEEIRTFSKNIENELSLFEINFDEAKKKLGEVETYIKQKFVEMRGQVEQLKKSNNCSAIPKMVDALMEIQNIISKFNDVDIVEIKNVVAV